MSDPIHPAAEMRKKYPDLEDIPTVETGTTERRCSTCHWWGTEEETHHSADERTCTWPKPFWMPIWKSHRDNILSRGCKTWKPK